MTKTSRDQVKMRKNFFQPNAHAQLSAVRKLPGKWVKENTAILVIHGMGNQLPLETIEQFGKTLVHAYQEQFNDLKFTIEHVVCPKAKTGSNYEWYDNVLRIRRIGEDAYIDIYEYYWAHYTENTAGWDDINSWIKGVAAAGKKFYERNEALSESVKEKKNIITGSPFNYFLLLNIVGQLVTLYNLAGKSISSLLSRVPILGNLLDSALQSYKHSKDDEIVNVLADLVAYMVTDAKSKYYPIRRAILDGAVEALVYLLENGMTNDDNVMQHRTYPKVLVAGHSLGSQVGYDAINKINLMVNACEIGSYDNKGNCKVSNGLQLKDQLSGFITFGSPLDKTAFFLREQIPSDQFVRQQLLNDFFNFKQRDWTPYLVAQPGYFHVQNLASPERLLEDIKWRNYYDRKDYVSGALDYYKGLVNVNCDFGEKGVFAFTHSNYWDCHTFYRDIINEFL